MPKRKKRRQNDSSRAMQQALDHYECALRNLEDADEPAALEALDFAEVFLERAQDDDVRRGLVAEVSLARGALLEVADPMNARLAYDRSFSADGNAAAALRHYDGAAAAARSSPSSATTSSGGRPTTPKSPRRKIGRCSSCGLTMRYRSSTGRTTATG